MNIGKKKVLEITTNWQRECVTDSSKTSKEKSIKP